MSKYKPVNVDAFARAIYKKQCNYVGADHEGYCVEELKTALQSMEDEISRQSCEVSTKTRLIDEAISMLNEIATTETDIRNVGGFEMYVGEELQPFMDVEITQEGRVSEERRYCKGCGRVLKPGEPDCKGPRRCREIVSEEREPPVSKSQQKRLKAQRGERD